MVWGRGYTGAPSLLVAVVSCLRLTAATLQLRILPPLKTSGPHILDSTERPIRLSCVNWYGAEEKDYVVGGLHKQSVSYIAQLIKTYGFNCVRLPFSLELVLHNPTIPAYAVTAEKSLQGEKALEGLDKVVNNLSSQKLAIILDNHMSNADWCCSESDGNGLWYTNEYDEQDWIQVLVTLVKRYKHLGYVVGVDLRNELRPTVVNGKHLSPTWANGHNTTDWHAAAERCANILQSVNPDLLIFVEGLSYASDLTGVMKHPIQLTVPNHVVYEAHDYSWFHRSGISYEQYKSEINQKWGYLVKTQPLWLGEFGTCNTGPSCYSDRSSAVSFYRQPEDKRKDSVRNALKKNDRISTAGSRGWWSNVHRYLNETGIGWSYWSVDGTESTGTGRRFGAPETFGVLNSSWSGPSAVGLLKSLEELID